MSENGFEQSNQAFLKAATRWLRETLRAAAAERTSPGSDAEPGRANCPTALAGVQRVGPVQSARAALDRAAGLQPAPSFINLVKRFRLSSFERDMLLFAATMEIDASIPDLIAAANGDATKCYPTFALAMSLFAEPSWDALSPQRPLRADSLVEIHQSGVTSLLAAPLRIDERIAAYIKGLNYVDERLAALSTPMPVTGPLPRSQETLAEALAQWLRGEVCKSYVQLTGTHSPAKADVVARAAALCGCKALAIHAEAIPSSASELETFRRLWAREAKLLPLVLFIQGVDAHEPLAGGHANGRLRACWPRALRDIDVPCLVDVPRPLAELDTAASIAIAPPTDAERRELWRAALEIDRLVPNEALLARLAGEFKATTSQIETLAGRARAFSAASGDSMTASSTDAFDHAWASCVQHAGAALAGATRWIEPRASLEHVKLPQSETEQLQRLVTHAHHRSMVASEFGFAACGERGLGLTALFYGESGTGKTLAAEAIANALSLALAVIDLATVKSKYIGETEKNLRRVFDAAEHGGAVLFFDEADALFGKRSEVKDSHDRYANVEINFLLMRMEQFGGVAILATNQRHALDPAFMRRLRFVVAFPFPGVAERKAIWQSVFPARTPLGELDFDRLARFSLTGGSIFNAALAAAHAAAADGTWVEMKHVLDAIRWELRKLERPVVERAFASFERDVDQAVYNDDVLQSVAVT